MSIIYVTAKETKSGLYRITDDQDGSDYGTVKSSGDADSLVKDAHGDVGLTVIVTTIPLAAQ